MQHCTFWWGFSRRKGEIANEILINIKNQLPKNKISQANEEACREAESSAITLRRTIKNMIANLNGSFIF